MNVYLVDNMMKGGRFFNDEESLLSFLLSEKSKNKKTVRCKVRVIDGSTISECSGEQYLVQKTVNNLLDVTDEDFLIKVRDFKNMFIEVAPNNRKKRDFLDSMGIVPIKPNDFIKFFKKWESYLVYELSTNEDWYECLFSIYEFKKIEDFKVVEFISKQTGGSTWGNCRTSDLRKNNFNKAKKKYNLTKKPS